MPATTANALVELASSYGVATSWVDRDGTRHQVSASTVLAVLHALGVETDDLSEALEARHRKLTERLAPPFVAAIHGRSDRFEVHVPTGDTVTVIALCADGSKRALAPGERQTLDYEYEAVAIKVPADLPVGLHQALVLAEDGSQAKIGLLIAPEKLQLPAPLSERSAWGVSTQLYQGRSHSSWGIGEYADLAALAPWVGEQLAADFLCVGVVGGPHSTHSVAASPYVVGATARLNPLYISIEQIEELEQVSEATLAEIDELRRQAQNLNRQPIINHRKVWELKRQALELIWAECSPDSEFSAYCTEDVFGWGTWCAIEEAVVDEAWPEEFERPEGRLTGIFAQSHGDRVLFYCWLQWVAEQQLSKAQEALRAAGMSMGLIQEVAWGATLAGAEEWLHRDLLIAKLRGGRPPEQLTPAGLDYGTVVWHPEKLAEANYEPFRAAIEAIMARGAGVSLTEVSRLHQQWVIPEGCPPEEGTFLSYDWDAMLGLVVLAAQQAGVVVIGQEELGRPDPRLRARLAERGVLGTSILWDEWTAAGQPVPASEYRSLCLASLLHRDLPPTVGHLELAHLADPAQRRRELERVDLVRLMLHEQKLVAFGAGPDGYVMGLHAHLSQTPAKMVCLALADMVGETRPWHRRDLREYPHWSLPLSDENGRLVYVDELGGSE